MKNTFTLFLFLSICTMSFGQALLINFETGVTTSSFVDFDGGVATVLANPQPNGINTSAQVGKIVRNGGAIWAGSKIRQAQNLNFTTASVITMKVFTTAPIGTVVKLKLEGNGQTERDARTTVTGAWETLSFDFTGAPTAYIDVVFMFDFGNVGNGTVGSTFLFDDVAQVTAGAQIDLPVTFETSGVNYTMTDFGGNVSSLVPDPTNSANRVIKVVKTAQASTTAGTTIGTPGGFAKYIPLKLTDSKMSIRVWSPTAGTTIRLKVEDSADPTHTCETETKTTLAGQWETLKFDFLNQAPGTATLTNGLSMGWKYNKASIFFNFGISGASAGEKTYYFDQVVFGVTSSTETTQDLAERVAVFPNPSAQYWMLTTTEAPMISVEIFDMQGRLIYTAAPQSNLLEIEATSMMIGVYQAVISTREGLQYMKLVKE
jgi:hypothetical protein